MAVGSTRRIHLWEWWWNREEITSSNQVSFDENPKKPNVGYVAPQVADDANSVECFNPYESDDGFDHKPVARGRVNATFL